MSGCECGHGADEHHSPCAVCGCEHFARAIDPDDDMDEAHLPGPEVRSDQLSHRRVF